ncbi:MAG: acyltransferase [Bosea sp. (in: a-proteobacteria)]|uniref:acyltransferase n=1 Tax=Bosea sp. (in: a-proteobacteria) TaxID=1871050 RepID=UPI003F7BCE41
MMAGSRIRRVLFHGGLLLSLSATLALGGESAASLVAAGMPSSCGPFAAKVSASEGNFSSVNQAGCLGAFQFCPGTFERYYHGSAENFLRDPQAQVAAWSKYTRDSWSQAERNGLTSLIGQQVCHGGRCATIDQSAILFACQFGCGRGGKLANYAASGDCSARNVKDGNLVSVCSYMIKGAGYDASCLADQQSMSCIQTAASPGDYPTSMGIAANPPSPVDASIIVTPDAI